MTVSTRTPYEGRPTSRPAKGGRVMVEDSIPSVEEAKRRLAAASGREQPWLHLTPEFKEAMAQAEDAAGGWLVGPEVYQPPDAE